MPTRTSPTARSGDAFCVRAPKNAFRTLMIKPARVNGHLINWWSDLRTAVRLRGFGYFFVKLKKLDLCPMRPPYAPMDARGGSSVRPGGRSFRPLLKVDRRPVTKPPRIQQPLRRFFPAMRGRT